MVYTLRPLGDPVAIRLDGYASDGSDPNRNGLSDPTEENDRDLSIENALGGAGPDFIRSLLTGANILSGNGGDDRIYARDGAAAADTVSCGGGTDRFQADPSDTTSLCETAIP